MCLTARIGTGIENSDDGTDMPEAEDSGDSEPEDSMDEQSSQQSEWEGGKTDSEVVTCTTLGKQLHPIPGVPNGPGRTVLR